MEAVDVQLNLENKVQDLIDRFEKDGQFDLHLSNV